MKCRFYLLDINEDRQQSKPTIRLWGIDGKGKRVLVSANQVIPYFYFMPDEQTDPGLIRDRLLNSRTEFPKIIDIIMDTKKCLGRTRNVLKIVCSDSQVPADYAKKILKSAKGGVTFEDDLGLAARYITDLMLTPCGWNECDAEKGEHDELGVDYTYVATASPRNVNDGEIPKLRILAFKILALSEKGSAKSDKDPVRVIAVATNSGTSGTFVAEDKDDSLVLKGFLAFLGKFDPDFLVGFENNRLEWPYLIERCKGLKIKLNVGRDESEPHTSLYGHISVAGRANLDLFDVAGGIQEVKVKTIENVAKYLHVPSASKVTTIEEYDRYSLWMNVSGRKRLIEDSKTNAQALLEIAEATINYPIQLSALTGLPLDQVMAAAVGFRVDSYLGRQAHLIGEMIPHKNEQPFFTYRGAIVLEPKTGLHENIVVLDFASMYPNLMVNYNLSPDTLVKPDEEVPGNSVHVIPEVKHRFRKTPDGFYRVVLRKLIELRSQVKNELEKVGQKTTRYMVLKERERAIKIITNACYGYAGWAGARWYVREVAESATALGREAITKTIEKAASFGLDVIYGDTDSIFVKNDPNKIEKLREWVDKEFKLDIRPEREYVRVLFTEAMKRYAGLLPNGSLDIVGLEVVRGDWSDIARQVQEQVLESILREQSIENAVEKVRGIIRKLKNGEVSIADLTIRKTLTKPIEDYKVRAAHVDVARKLLKDGWSLDVGDKIAYVIAKGSGSLFQKAKPYGYVKPEEVDTEYYLENQVKPAAMRILELFGVTEKQLAV